MGSGDDQLQTDATGGRNDRRTIRTYARRDDAERARDLLGEHGIEAQVREFRIPDPDGGPEMVSRGCSLSVLPKDVAGAARLLLRMPPTEAAGKPQTAQEPAPRPRRRPRAHRTRRQSSAIWILIIAIGCSTAAMFYIVYAFLNPAAGARISVPGEEENYVVREDLDWDGIIDIEREYSPGGAPVQVREDRNGDGLFELRWNWERGVLATRDRDIDHNGISDERTVFDPAGDPFYVDLRPNGSGPVINRRIYREGVLWKILDDADADARFDRIREYDVDGTLLRDEPLPKGSPENDPPKLQRLPAAPE